MPMLGKYLGPYRKWAGPERNEMLKPMSKTFIENA
jgi:hypothetical protein